MQTHTHTYRPPFIVYVCVCAIFVAIKVQLSIFLCLSTDMGYVYRTYPSVQSYDYGSARPHSVGVLVPVAEISSPTTTFNSTVPHYIEDNEVSPICTASRVSTYAYTGYAEKDELVHIAWGVHRAMTG